MTLIIVIRNYLVYPWAVSNDWSGTLVLSSHIRKVSHHPFLYKQIRTIKP
jgi:hypothetical protein